MSIMSANKTHFIRAAQVAGVSTSLCCHKFVAQTADGIVEALGESVICVLHEHHFIEVSSRHCAAPSLQFMVFRALVSSNLFDDLKRHMEWKVEDDNDQYLNLATLRAYPELVDSTKVATYSLYATAIYSQLRLSSCTPLWPILTMVEDACHSSCLILSTLVMQRVWPISESITVEN